MEEKNSTKKVKNPVPCRYDEGVRKPVIPVNIRIILDKVESNIPLSINESRRLEAWEKLNIQADN